MNFARTGNPAGPGLPPWPVYDPQTDELLSFGLHGTTGEPDPGSSALDLTEVAQVP